MTHNRIIGQKHLALCASIFLAITTPNVAFAQANAGGDPNVACVQNQFTTLGIDVGAIDGLFGRKTATGAVAVANKFPKLSKLNSISKDNAIMWCRELGLQSAKLKSYWPTHDGKLFEYFFSGSVDENEQKHIRAAMNIAANYYEKHDIRLAGKTKIVASDNLTTLAKTINKVARNPIPTSKGLKILKKQCSNKEMSGININGLIALCLTTNTDINKNLRDLKDIAVHEYAHEIQRQLTSYTKTLARNRADIVAANGPRWLVEATAITFANDYTNNGVNTDILIGLLRGEEDRYSGRTLSSLRYGDAPEKEIFGNYAGLAGQLLVQKKGLKSIFDFWKQMARSDWKTAFAATYGLTIDAFYKEFNWTQQTPLKSLSKPILTSGDGGIACVQQQLTTSGIDVGPIDGLYGRKTIRGSKKLIDKYPSLSELDDLTRDNGLSWCRQIGLIDASQQLYWPAKQKRVDFITGHGFTSSQNTTIKQAVNGVFAPLAKNSFQPTGQFIFIANRSGAAIDKYMAANKRKPVDMSDISQQIKNRCNGTTEGVSTDGIVAICIGSDFKNTEAYKKLLKHKASYLITQEYIRQSAGYTWPNRQLSDQFFHLGPRWLYEGMALALADHVVDPKRTIRTHIALRRSQRKAIKSDLHQLEAYGQAPPEKHQKKGVYAAHILAQKGGGYNSFVTYWDDLSRSNWQVAFQLAFNISVGEFYKQMSDD